MKSLKKFKDRLTGLTDAIGRFQLTTLFLLAAAVVNAHSISTQKNDTKLLLTFILGAFLSAVAQVGYERFFSNYSSRMVLMGAAILLTGGYYLVVRPAPDLSTEIVIRTVVAMLALLWAFIWVPIIKSHTSFNKSFMITFKSFFISLFFSGIIYGGISIILVAFNKLIFQIGYTAYPHTANLIFILFAPLY